MAEGLGLFLLLVCVPDTGHLIPMLNIAAQLSGRGDVARVQLASLELARDRVEAAGIDFVSLDLNNISLEEGDHEQDALTMAMIHTMTPNLIEYLRELKSVPDALVVDGLSMPGWLASELLNIPLVLVYPLPLSVSLVFSGNGNYNLPFHVPFPGYMEDMTFTRRYISSTFMKILFSQMLWGGQTKRWDPIRKGYGLPAMGRCAALTGKQKVLYLVGHTLELDVARKMPASMHVVGPLSTHRSTYLAPNTGGTFSWDKDEEKEDVASDDPSDAKDDVASDDPSAANDDVASDDPSAAKDDVASDDPSAAKDDVASDDPSDAKNDVDPKSSEDVAALSFLDDALANNVHVVYVATGTRWVLDPQLTKNMTKAFLQMTRTACSTDSTSASSASSDCSTPAVRFLWVVIPVSRRMLDSESESESDFGGMPQYLDSSTGLMVLPWVNQPAVLMHPAVKLFLSHCGIGSVHEGLTAGKPILAMPFKADQPTLANQIQSRGLGFRIDPDNVEDPLTPARLRYALNSMLEDPYYAKNAAAVGDRLRSQVPGAVKAADLVTEFAQSCAAPAA